MSDHTHTENKILLLELFYEVMCLVTARFLLYSRTTLMVECPPEVIGVQCSGA
jgi:hypothetical protein